MGDLEAELFANQLDALLLQGETAIQAAVLPEIDQLLARLDAAVAAGVVITDADLERLLVPVNDTLARALSEQMEITQDPLRQLAARVGEVGAGRLLLGTTLMELAAMDGTSMAAWFERRSPSQWMGEPMRILREAIEAGWNRDQQARAAVRSSLVRLVNTAAETGMWSHGNGRLIANWTAQELQWITRLDEKVCPICGPKHGTRFSGASNGPPAAAHPRCRCVGVPVQGEVIT